MQQRLLRVLSFVALFLSAAFFALWISYGLFDVFSERYLNRQMITRSELHQAQLETYYENEQFGRMQAYMQRYSLFDDATYVKFQQALDLYDRITMFRNRCYALQNLSPAETESGLSIPFLDPLFTVEQRLEAILYDAYSLYHYPDFSSYPLLISPNDELLTDLRSEVSLTLQNVLHLDSFEIRMIRSDVFWDSRYTADFFADLSERLVISNE